MEDTKKLMTEELTKMKSLMGFKAGMTKTELREILENGLKAEMQESADDLPATEMAEDVKEGDVTEKFDFVRDVVNKNKKKGDDDDGDEKEDDDDDDDDKKKKKGDDDDDDEKEEDVKEEEVTEEPKEDMFKKPEIKDGGYNMSQGFVNESAPSNKETKLKNKQDRLDRKFGRV